MLSICLCIGYLLFGSSSLSTKGKRRFYICVLVQRKIAVWVAKKPDIFGLFAGDIFLSPHYGGPEGIRTLDLSDANRTLSQLSYKPGYGKMGWNKLVPPHHYTHFCGKCKCFIPLSGALPSRRRSGGTEPRARPRPLRCAAPSSSGRTWRPRRPSRTPSPRRPR